MRGGEGGGLGLSLTGPQGKACPANMGPVPSGDRFRHTNPVPSESMATVRLFARLRELAGSARVQIDGATVGEVVDEAGRRFGPEFVAAVGTARVWRNGDEANRDDPVDADDEVALLPPVSGGAATMTSSRELAVAVPLLVGALLVIVNLQADPAWWAAMLVGAAGVWVIDVAQQMESRGRQFPAVAVVVGAVAGAIISQSLGPVGLAVAVGLAVVVVMAWGVGIAGYRSVDTVAPGVMVGMLAAAAVGSLVLTRSGASPDPQAVDMFLLVVILATLLGSAVDRMADLPYLDPYTVTALVAILGSVITATVWNLDVAGYLLVGLGLALTLVAGRGLGALLRTGRAALADRAPGFLRALDGPLLAAALYFPIIRLVL